MLYIKTVHTLSIATVAISSYKMKLLDIIVVLMMLCVYVHADVDDTVGDDTEDQQRDGHLIQALRGCANALQSDTPDGNYHLSEERILCRLDELQKSIDNLMKICISHVQPSPGPLPTSCQDIAERWPNSSSGVYLIASKTGTTHYAYCSFYGPEGWTRIAYLNMSDSSTACPDELQLLQSNDGVRGCGRKPSNGGSCNGVTFATNASYSEVCGRVIGYQVGSPDAAIGSPNDINSYYVDGVSITCGSTRQHVWTFMAGLHEETIYAGNGGWDCPCATGSTQTVLPFIGDDYFCESGNPGRHV